MKTSSWCATGLLEPLEARIAPALIYGVDSNNHLLVFDSSKTQTLISDDAITGIGAGESIIGVDFRPATGGLYAITRDAGGVGRLYLVSTGANPAAAHIGTNFGFTLPAGHYDIDFNPMVDRIRVVNDTGLNFRINPNDGTFLDSDANGGNGLTPDGTLVYAPGDPNAAQTPSVSGLAYTNAFAGTTSTEVFTVETAIDTLAKIAVPNNGQMTSATKTLGAASDYVAGFDILAGDTFGYAALHSGSSTKLYSIDLASGKAKSLGVVKDSGNLVSFSVALGHLGVSAPGTLTYRDIDGDTVTIKASKGTLLGTTQFTLANSLGGMQLQKITLPNASFADASIAITAKASPTLGNGFVNVGQINAMGTDLKAVTVKGDLGSLIAGNGGLPALSVGTLSVASIGLVGASSQEAGGMLNYVFTDGAGSFRVTNDIQNAALTLGAVKTFSAGGSILATALNFGALGTANIGLGLTTVTFSALSTKSISVGQMVFSSNIDAGTSLGSLSVKGDAYASTLTADTIGPVKIGGSFLYSRLEATHGSIGAITVGHDWSQSLILANVDPDGDTFYGTTDDTTTTSVGDPLAKIASLTIKGQLASTTTGTYAIEANVIGKVSIGGRNVALTSGLDNFLLGPGQNIRLRELSAN